MTDRTPQAQAAYERGVEDGRMSRYVRVWIGDYDPPPWMEASLAPSDWDSFELIVDRLPIIQTKPHA